jgi:serine protease Do
MISVDRVRRLGGVSLLVIAALGAGAVLERTSQPAYALQQDPAPAFSAAVPNGAPMSFADLIEGVSPAVVTIQASTDAQALVNEAAPNMDDVPPQFREWLERQFNERQQQPQPAQPRQSLGSGFFISADGHVVTNNHVVAGATEITIGTADGETYPAQVVGLDPQTDLALLKVDEDVIFPFVTLDSDPHYRVGDWVVAVGNPFGLGGTATAGIISATGREIGNSAYNDFIQIDAPINRGNSGGPTFDLNGNVVGVNSQIFSPSGGNVGIGFAIPSDIASRIIAQLMNDGRVARGWLGVSIQNITEDIAETVEGLGEPRGAIVSSIVADGPASNGGIERGDVILSINGDEVDGSSDLTRRIGEISADERVSFRVLRDGRERTIRVTLGDRPDDETLSNMSNVDEAPAEVSYFGMTLVPLGDEDREVRGLAAGTNGLVVDTVDPASEAARKGLRNGDVVLEAGGDSVADIDAFADVIAAARADDRSAILLLVEGRGGQRYVALQIDEAE